VVPADRPVATVAGVPLVRRRPLTVALTALTALVALVACADPGDADRADGTAGTAATSPSRPAPTSAPAGSPAEQSGGSAPSTIPSSSAGQQPVSRPVSPLPVAEIGDAIVVASEPVDITVRPGTGRVYVAERQGYVRPIVDAPGGSSELGQPVLDVSAELEPGFEEGLLGFTFSPDGGHLYVQTTTGGRTTVWAYPADAAGVLDDTARREVIVVEQPYEAHNGGDLAFGPDGYLYVFLGDGGFVGDPQRRALDLSSYKGKILRIDPTPGADEPYRVPAENPFVDDPDAIDEIWAVGLRNPWRASFDPLTGDLWIGDVGDFAWEEINVAWADEGGGRGLSYGWSAFEGSERFNEDQPADGHEFPFFEYPHGDEGCSVTAGERYRGTAVPDLVGWFVFADFCSGVVRGLEVTADRTAGRMVELGVVPLPVSVRAGPGNELFVVSIEGGVYPLLAG
jgi:glucose/arabinose dehydrogenase